MVNDRGRNVTSADPVCRAQMAARAGAGEIILQNVDRDGERKGYDTELISSVSGAVDVPVVALGGAGELSHLGEALRAGANAVASGSAFVLIGRLRAVLVTYPSPQELDAMLANAGIT